MEALSFVGAVGFEKKAEIGLKIVIVDDQLEEQLHLEVDLR